MGYRRVIPRDLFNEANLLKCYGRIYILLENTPDHRAAFGVEDVAVFDVQQSDDDGSLTVANVPLIVSGETITLRRPLNSRDAWPLYATHPQTGDDVSVFDAAGNFTSEMLNLIKGE